MGGRIISKVTIRQIWLVSVPRNLFEKTSQTSPSLVYRKIKGEEGRSPFKLQNSVSVAVLIKVVLDLDVTRFLVWCNL